MEIFNPGQTVIFNVQSLTSGLDVGFQLRKATTDSITLARTTTGVIERPAGTGNYVLNFVAPAEGDLYLLVVDWSDGALTPETSLVFELQVMASVIPGSSGLGAIADYVQMNIGGETWRGLTQSVDYGEGFIARAIDVVKATVSKTPIATVDEAALPVLVADYLGILATLKLITAARDYWGSQITSQSVGDEPTEIVTFVNRANLMNDLRDDLMRRLPDAERLATPLLETPLLRLTTDGPDIDEDDDVSRVTADPRCFPTARESYFPQRWQHTGVRL